MQEPLWTQEPRNRLGAVRTRSTSLGWLAVAVVVTSVVLLTGWPIPQSASGDSTPDTRGFQLFPGAFDEGATPTDLLSSASTAPAATEEQSRLSAQASFDELAEVRELFAAQQSTVERTALEPTVLAVAAPSAPSTAPQDTTQTDTPTPTTAPTVLSAPAVEPAAATGNPLAQVAPAVNPASLAFSTPESGLFDAMNEARIANGLQALIPKDMLTEAARARSEEMTRLGYFAHYYEGGTSALEFLRRADASYSWAGEHLAKVAGDETSHVVELAINALMASPTHRANILNSRAVHVGVGTVTSDDGVTIFTMIYADR